MLQLRRNDVLLRVGMCLMAAVCLWAATAPWEPPVTYRLGDIPQRDVIARVPFAVEEQPRDPARYVFSHHADRVTVFQNQLIRKVEEVAGATSEIAAWKEFQSAASEQDMKLASLAEFQKALDGNERWQAFLKAIEQALRPIKETGMLRDAWTQELSKPNEEAVEPRNQNEVDVYLESNPQQRTTVPIASLTVKQRLSDIQKSLEQQPATETIAGRLFIYIRDRLTPTLKFELEATRNNLEPINKQYQAGHRLAAAGQPIEFSTLQLLHNEHKVWAASAATAALWLHRSAAMFALIVGLFVLGAFYLYYRQPRLRQNVPHLTIIFGLLIGTVFFARWLSQEEWRPEIIPLALFGLTLGIAYGRELALLVTSATVGILVLAVGRSVAEFLVLWGVIATAVLLLTNIRNRLKLIEICSLAGAVACLLTIALGVFDGRPLNGPLLTDAVRMAGWTLVAGFLVTGLLPFIERLFGVLTDLSLLELSDPSHPLLQELVRRAPGTYNHSINVGALAESAAEAIGARGLLVRVGAYFHDIGKMLKPAYFAENQGQENRHETLAPAMSTLIIIAHIKDGADLARQHRLPQAIIDFIEQHHGTTLVEYFYKRAEAESLLNPDSSAVEEGAFRYPGPKPQTKETAVLMLADAVESASRTLSEPTPARIERLVEDIVMKRLMDDQFDECAINLRELRAVQDSLIKSLIAVYHGRVKYPTQRTA
jgi:putative nucleotidyltransferase with HDIG domain